MVKAGPEGKFMATVKVGAKGQIVIPKEVREMFGFSEGESVLLLADRERGVALQPLAFMEPFFNALKEVYPDRDEKKEQDN